MTRFAVIETGGKQYKVSAGQKLKIEKIAAKEGERVALDKVLLVVDGEAVAVGAPFVKDAKVEAEVLRHGREKKKIVFRYHSKTRYRKKKGHRQHFTEIKVL
ncbi:MAG: 50S ribosomal protein L21 [Parcubacteria group bacterium RIFCSPLOWO2_01_FULL_48_18]|nr:MAG: 50S ribosomal protein L21 [Parcubacteria group bacterium RIFCSPLOWO2_01_FULL_48_18]OHB23200.1 MAG: 50S ribosomal protein L21 [Parcubacteria group bacterium RIFCSPHIGHO2_02_FULL_48_10b]